MYRDERGDKHFSGTDEACEFLRTGTVELVRWLHVCREQAEERGAGVVFAGFPHYRTILNDLSNITQRLLHSQEAEIERLRLLQAGPPADSR